MAKKNQRTPPKRPPTPAPQALPAPASQPLPQNPWQSFVSWLDDVVQWRWIRNLILFAVFAGVFALALWVSLPEGMKKDLWASVWNSKAPGTPPLSPSPAATPDGDSNVSPPTPTAPPPVAPSPDPNSLHAGSRRPPVKDTYAPVVAGPAPSRDATRGPAVAAEQELQRQVRAAFGYAAGNADSRDRAVETFHAVVGKLPPASRNRLNGKLLREAEHDYRHKEYDSALIKYKALFTHFGQEDPRE